MNMNRHASHRLSARIVSVVAAICFAAAGAAVPIVTTATTPAASTAAGPFGCCTGIG